MGALGCNVAPSLLSRVVGQADQNRTEQSLPIIPRHRRRDGNRLAVLPGPGALVVPGGTGGMGTARHTEEHAPKHALILLAASPPCQVNGWASDSSLYIPTVPSHVEHCSRTADVVITTTTASTLSTQIALE